MESEKTTNALEITNEKNFVFAYKMGEVNIRISVGEKELGDLEEIANQFVQDVTNALYENNTQAEEEVGD